VRRAATKSWRWWSVLALSSAVLLVRPRVKSSASSSQKLRSAMKSSNATALGVMSGTDSYLRRHGARTVGRGWGGLDACLDMLVARFAWVAWLVRFTLVLFASFFPSSRNFFFLIFLIREYLVLIRFDLVVLRAWHGAGHG